MQHRERMREKDELKQLSNRDGKCGGRYQGDRERE